MIVEVIKDLFIDIVIEKAILKKQIKRESWNLIG